MIALPKPAGATEINTTTWVNDSFGLAKIDVYIAPISPDNDPKQKLSPKPTPGYRAAAKKVAESQVLLAGYRLAAVLDKELK